MIRFILLSLALSVVGSLFAQSQQQILDFEFEGVRLNGIVNFPINKEPKGIVIIVHGSGRTHAVAQDWYKDVRETMVRAGYSAYMWDKKGCGSSGGDFDYHQSVENSAEEVISAIRFLKKNKVSGSERIGLWGISRAGWIIPIVINQYKDIAFWISVSGVDEKENFKYLFEENLKLQGHVEDSVKLWVNEWQDGSLISHSGGSFEDYQEATKNLQRNKFWLRFTNGGITEEVYYNYQKEFTQVELDEETGLQVYVQEFDSILSQVSCPVLALFGENDRNVNWRNTLTLYKNTITTDLTIKTFAHCNHNMFQSKTGAFYEMDDPAFSYKRCEGYLESMEKWLNSLDL